jgi:hypothetical protein
MELCMRRRTPTTNRDITGTGIITATYTATRIGRTSTAGGTETMSTASCTSRAAPATGVMCTATRVDRTSTVGGMETMSTVACMSRAATVIATTTDDGAATIRSGASPGGASPRPDRAMIVAFDRMPTRLANRGEKP